MTDDWHRDGFTISTDKQRLDIGYIHGFLSEAYWAKNIPVEVVRRSIEHSLCFGLYETDRQIGFARVISDFATFAYLGDVFIDERFRGQGLGRWLVSIIMTHPELQDLRRWSLVTRDAHALYRPHGFAGLANPDRHMEISDLGIYLRPGFTAT